MVRRIIYFMDFRCTPMIRWYILLARQSANTSHIWRVGCVSCLHSIDHSCVIAVSTCIDYLGHQPVILSGLKCPVRCVVCSVQRLCSEKYHDHDDVMKWKYFAPYWPFVLSPTVYSGADQRKHQSSTSLAFVRGIHFPVERAENVENVSIWWRHHDLEKSDRDISEGHCINFNRASTGCGRQY